MNRTEIARAMLAAGAEPSHVAEIVGAQHLAADESPEPDEITRWADSLDPSDFVPIVTLRCDLDRTLDALASDGLWLEADDPLAFRAELADLARSQLSAWLALIG